MGGWLSYILLTILFVSVGVGGNRLARYGVLSTPVVMLLRYDTSFLPWAFLSPSIFSGLGLLGTTI